MKKRIAFIDELKGFAILMVVVGHVFYFSFRIGDVDYVSPWDELIASFHMPLFAFLSGLFVKAVLSWHSLRKITERLGLPLIFVGSLYTLWRGFDITSFVPNEFKYGYWYFLFLLQAYFIVTLFELTARVVNPQNRKVVTFAMMSLACLGISGGVKLLPVAIYDMLGCSHLDNYMPFIFAGFFISRYGLFDKVFSSKKLFEICSLLAFMTFVVRHYLHHGTAIYLLRPCLTYVVVALFYRLRNNDCAVKRTFQEWGRNSLEIYCLHYFLIHACSLPFVYEYTMNNGMELMEGVGALVLGVGMCYICVYIGKLIKMSEVFGYLCFGNRK